MAGALPLLAAWPDKPANLGTTLPTVPVGTALVYEFVLTAILMFVIIAVATDTRAVGAAAAIAIGGTVALDAFFGGPMTGASMNPARSFGPALASGTSPTSGSTSPAPPSAPSSACLATPPYEDRARCRPSRRGDADSARAAESKRPPHGRLGNILRTICVQT